LGSAFLGHDSRVLDGCLTESDVVSDPIPIGKQAPSDASRKTVAGLKVWEVAEQQYDFIRFSGLLNNPVERLGDLKL
jgi:hypothetical protein